jgi:c-di-GMP-binding flagellar brake protein YcgR
MVDEKREKRRLERIFFSIEDGITVTFIFADLQKELDLLTANVVNLSEGGLAITLSKDKDKGKKIGIGDHIILTQVKGIKDLEFLTNVETEIKWILDNPSLKFVAFGCEFFDLHETITEKIRTFIDARNLEKIGGRSKEQHL